MNTNILEIHNVDFAYPSEPLPFNNLSLDDSGSMCLGAHYKSEPLLFNNLSLDVSRGGQIKCVLGPSGVGKSTLLHLAMEEIKPKEGKVIVTGVYLPILQNFESMLLRWFNARTNITWGLNPQEYDKIDKVSELLEIKETLNSLPRHLSGGQKQRVVMARALVRHPDLLLLDEPLANLDSGTLKRILPRIQSFLHEQNVSALWVTHNVAEALMVADAVCVLHEGGILHEFPVMSPGGDESLAREIEKLLL